VRKTVLLLFSILLLIAFGMAVVAQTPDKAQVLPPDSVAHLQQYLTDRFGPGTAIVQRVARASRPWRFTPAMSLGTHEGSKQAQTAESSSIYGPLPFPPDQLWCVLVKVPGLEPEETLGRSPYAIVFLGLHIDMYNADWVAHDGIRDLSAPESTRVLSLIGCDLELDLVGPRENNRDSRGE
jgi:hypothetical protein